MSDIMNTVGKTHSLNIYNLGGNWQIVFHNERLIYEGHEWETTEALEWARNLPTGDSFIWVERYHEFDPLWENRQKIEGRWVYRAREERTESLIRAIFGEGGNCHICETPFNQVILAHAEMTQGEMTFLCESCYGFLNILPSEATLGKLVAYINKDKT